MAHTGRCPLDGLENRQDRQQSRKCWEKRQRKREEIFKRQISKGEEDYLSNDKIFMTVSAIVELSSQFKWFIFFLFLELLEKDEERELHED